jgi:hypothetical protein
MQAAAGDVDEDIDAAVIQDDLLKSFFYVGFPGYIQADARRLFASPLDFGCDLFSTVLIHVQNHYSKIVPGQTLYYCLSNP